LRRIEADGSQAVRQGVARGLTAAPIHESRLCGVFAQG
jgi:hypothetical protein